MAVRVRKLPPDSDWYARVHLDQQEWPPTMEETHWTDRPIRQWVNEHCQSPHFFTFSGTILFSSESDLVNFLLTWS